MIDNPLQMNDWGINKFLISIGVVQFALICVDVLNCIGIFIPLLPQIIGIIYLLFIPGIIILRILRMHNLGSAVTLLYTVGLSLVFDMFLGFLVNFGLPQIGIAQPVSLLPLLISWAIVLGILCFVAWARDKQYSGKTGWKPSVILSPAVLIFILLPLLAVAGAGAVNHFDNNIVLLVLIALIALIALVMITTKLIPSSLYPLAVFSMGLSLLLHSSMISAHLTGWDIFTEFYYYSQVILHGYWDASLQHTYNAMLSITILPAVGTYFLNSSGEYFFKIIYPLIYALVPVALYVVYSKQVGERRAFAAVFFFIAIYVFSLTMTSLCRQMIAELFYVLLIMLVLDKQITGGKKLLFILFGAGMIVSHYALSYIVIAFMVLSLVILYLIKERKSQVTITTIILFGVICLSWYIFISSAAPFTSILDVGKRIFQYITTDFFNLFQREGLLAFTETSYNTIHLVARIIYYLMLLFTALGAFRLLPGRNKSFSREYLAFAFGSYALLAACMIIPFFSQALGTERMFHLAVIILAPLTILGIEDTLTVLNRLAHFNLRRLHSANRITAGVLLAIFFMINTGFIFELTHDSVVESLPLSLSVIEKDSRDLSTIKKIEFRYICPTEQEISSARWLNDYREINRPVYATYFDIRVPSLVAYGLIPEYYTIPILSQYSSLDIKRSYVYLGYVNVVYGYGVTNPYFVDKPVTETALWDINKLMPALADNMKIYDNGASEIFFSQ
jgi:uncharacterized membrane protein